MTPEVTILHRVLRVLSPGCEPCNPTAPRDPSYVFSFPLSLRERQREERYHSSILLHVELPLVLLCMVFPCGARGLDLSCGRRKRERERTDLAGRVSALCAVQVRGPKEPPDWGRWDIGSGHPRGTPSYLCPNHSGRTSGLQALSRTLFLWASVHSSSGGPL